MDWRLLIRRGQWRRRHFLRWCRFRYFVSLSLERTEPTGVLVVRLRYLETKRSKTSTRSLGQRYVLVMSLLNPSSVRRTVTHNWESPQALILPRPSGRILQSATTITSTSKTHPTTSLAYSPRQPQRTQPGTRCFRSVVGWKPYPVPESPRPRSFRLRTRRRSCTSSFKPMEAISPSISGVRMAVSGLRIVCRLVDDLRNPLSVLMSTQQLLFYSVIFFLKPL